MADQCWRQCAHAALLIGAVGCQTAGGEGGDTDGSGTEESTETGTDESTSGETTGTGFFDECPDDPEKLVPGDCGCGEPDEDDDGDDVADCIDTCLAFPNVNQSDADDDGLGDACDPCPDDDDAACTCFANDATCKDGMADEWPCSGVDLVHVRGEAGFGAMGSNDVWAWVDPLTDREYAIVGLDIGVAFVDVTDPACTTYLGLLPTHTVRKNWRDMKTHADVLYVVSEAEAHGLQMFDLTALADVTDPPVVFEETAHFDGFGTGHNLAINAEVSTLYMFDGDECDNGIYIADISTPLTPVFAGCYDAAEVHDAHCVTYHGPDVEHDGKQICITANGGDLTIGVVDVTDPAKTVELVRLGYEGAFYPHQGSLTDDHVYFMLGDEADELSGVPTTTYLWDMSDLDDPVHMGNYVAATAATDHNMYVLDGRLYQANYHAGLRILDLSEVADAKLSELGFFDTYPPNDDEGYGTTWGVYPYLPSGNVLVTSEGLYVVHPTL